MNSKTTKFEYDGEDILTSWTGSCRVCNSVFVSSSEAGAREIARDHQCPGHSSMACFIEGYKFRCCEYHWPGCPDLPIHLPAPLDPANKSE